MIPSDDVDGVYYINLNDYIKFHKGGRTILFVQEIWADKNYGKYFCFKNKKGSSVLEFSSKEEAMNYSENILFKRFKIIDQKQAKELLLLI